MLTALLLIPVIGSLLLLPINEESNVTRMKQVALLTSMVNFILSIVLWGEFDSAQVQYQFVQEFNSLSFCHLNIGIDGISLYFVLLTTFITPLCILANWDNIKFGMKYFLIAFLLIETLLIAVFVVLDLMLFYIFFESVLIPMFLVVGIWGGSVTRIRASFLLFLYTLAGSLFMLLSIMVIYYNVGSTDFTVVSLSELSLKGQQILWLGFFLSFAVKTPLVPLHMWLPRAHAEAPLGASILLASVFLKMATYGYLRVMITMLPDATFYFSPLVQTMAVISIVYSSLATLRQSDFKALVAYSSVGHMGVVVLGLFSNTVTGIEGAVLLSIAHGLISPAMFIMVGGILYDRFHTRTIRYYRGMAVYMPVFSALFFLATACNMGIPLSLNWTGEVLSLTGMFQKSPIIAVLGASSIVLSACYSIFLFNRISFGAYSQYLSFTTDISRREFMLLLPLLLLTFIFGIVPNIILSDIHVSVTQLLYTIPFPEQMFGITGIVMSACNHSTAKSTSETVRGMFEQATAKDLGGLTTNPYLVYSRLIKRGGPFTLEDLHSIQILTAVTPISREDYENYKNLPGKDFTLPMTSRRADVLGYAKGKDTRQGIYIFTNLLNGFTRVGSATNLARRLGEHFSLVNSKASNILKKAFLDVGMSNFKLTIIEIPNTVSYSALLGLEQYYMLKLNPHYCLLKVVESGIAKGQNIMLALTEEALLKHRLDSGVPFYLYNAGGELLYQCLSIGEFKSLFDGITGHNIYYRHIHAGTLYKGALQLLSIPRDTVSVPLFTTEKIKAFLKGLLDAKFDYDTRSPDPKSDKVLVTVQTGNELVEVIGKSVRDAVDQLKGMGLVLSRKRISAMAALTKATGTPSVSQVGDTLLTLTMRK